MKTFGIILSLADPYIHGKLQQQPQTWLEMVRNLNKLAVYTFFEQNKPPDTILQGHHWCLLGLAPPKMTVIMGGAKLSSSADTSQWR